MKPYPLGERNRQKRGEKEWGPKARRIPVGEIVPTSRGGINSHLKPMEKGEGLYKWTGPNDLYWQYAYSVS